MLNNATEVAEVTCSTTSSDGRHVIRQQTKQLKENFENIFDKVTNLTRELESRLFERHSTEESLSQLGRWLDVKEAVLRNDLLESDSFEEKKKQLQQHQVSYLTVLISMVYFIFFYLCCIISYFVHNC